MAAIKFIKKREPMIYLRPSGSLIELKDTENMRKLAEKMNWEPENKPKAKPETKKPKKAN